MNNTLKGITAFLAGAGTGKTYQICEEIKASILDGMPADRIIATTFTKKAAAELKDRVKTHLYKHSTLTFRKASERARELEEAAIGTVHGLGHFLLNKYALQLGLSPELTVLDEDGSERHLDAFLETINPDRLQRLYDRGTPFDIKDVPDRMRALLAEKRLNDIHDDAFRKQMKDSVERLCDILAPDGPDQSLPSFDEYQTFLKEQYDQLRTLNRKADHKYIREIIENLEEALNENGTRWKVPAKLSTLTCSGKNEEARRICGTIRELSEDMARKHPDLLAGLKSFVTALAEEVIRFETDYGEYKKERGLLDYRDLEVQFLRALRNETVAEDIAESFDLLLVDEFQDSNPIQLAIFIRLHEIIGNSYWVGDEKQSIYGFRDADLALIRDAFDLIDASDVQSLNTSYRAHSGLISLFNDLFDPVFEGRVELDANQKEPLEISIERWSLDAGNREDDALAVVAGIRELLDESFDPGDIAVLTRNNFDARRVGEKLGEAQIPSSLERPGLLSSRECAVTVAGLRILADAEDTAAIAELHHLLESAQKDTPDWIINRLESVNEKKEAGRDRWEVKQWNDSRYVQRLSEIDEGMTSPSAAVSAVIQKLDLPDRMAAWGSPDRRSANLDALVDMATQYENEMRERSRGMTLRGLIDWFENKREEDQDMMPALEGVDAVTISTIHSAKGLEWPAVILMGLNSDYEPDPWEPETTGGNVREGKPLENREIRYWQWPYGKHFSYYGWSRVNNWGLTGEALDTDEGQNLKNRRHREENRVFYVAMTRASERLILTHRKGNEDVESRMGALEAFPLEQVLGPDKGEGTFDLEKHDTGIRIRHLPPLSDNETKTPETVRDIRIEAGELESKQDRFIKPSHHESEANREEVHLETESLPGKHPFPETMNTEHWDDLGNAVHTFFAGLPSYLHMNEHQREEIARRCLSGYGEEETIGAGPLAKAATRFRDWLERRYALHDIATEVPVTSPLENGQGTGEMDMVVEEKRGMTIIDHKIKPVSEPLWKETAATYIDQMQIYRKMLLQGEMKVNSCWIHLPLGGGTVRIDFEPSGGNAEGERN